MSLVSRGGSWLGSLSEQQTPMFIMSITTTGPSLMLIRAKELTLKSSRSNQKLSKKFSSAAIHTTLSTLQIQVATQILMAKNFALKVIE